MRRAGVEIGGAAAIYNCRDNSRIAFASLSTLHISAMRPWMQVRWPKVT